MAQEQQNISISAPGFGGLNTQDSPVSMDIAYAAQADHCIIDKAGRIASRLGFQTDTTNAPVLTGNPVKVMGELVQNSGETWVFACGNGEIYKKEDTTLVALTLPVDYVISDDYWQIIGFNNKAYFLQEGHNVLVFDPVDTDTTSLREMLPTADPFPAGPPNCGTAAFGHLWVADFDSDSSTLVWSDLLDGEGWDTAGTGDAGSIDLYSVWPMGQDEVVAIRAHNDFLIVFGTHSILVYSVPDTGPADMTLTDTVSALGCIARDSVDNTGDDIFFCDATGIRSLMRTIQEKSMPIGDISANIRTDIQELITTANPKTIQAIYSPEQAYYVVSFQEAEVSYVFDTRQPLENGALRPTRWPNIPIYCALRTLGGTTYFAGTRGVYTYKGANDIFLDPVDDLTPYSSAIRLKYYTNPQDFDMPAKLIFPRQLDITLIGSSDLEMYVYWAYDYNSTFNKDSITLLGITPSYYNVAEYDEGKYGGQSSSVATPKVNLWGSGRNVKFGFEASVSENQLSIQELNIQAIMGRII